MSHQAAVIFAGAQKRIAELKEAEKLEDSFYEFCKLAWPWVFPDIFVDNWHLEDNLAFLQQIGVVASE